jgi:membrane protein involved in colicin uptake
MSAPAPTDASAAPAGGADAQSKNAQKRAQKEAQKAAEKAAKDAAKAAKAAAEPGTNFAASLHVESHSIRIAGTEVTDQSAHQSGPTMS